MWKCIFLFFLINIAARHVKCQSLSDADTLLTNLFSSYNKELRPAIDQSQVLPVSMAISLFSIFDFDEIEGIISLVASPMLIWTDYRLIWDPSTNGYLEEITVPKTKLWIPNIFIVNPAKKMEAVGGDDFIGRVNASGVVTWIPGGIIKSTCSVDMTYFPFDTQVCGVIIAAWGYFPHEVVLIPAEDDVDYTFYQSNQMWDIHSSKLERHTLSWHNGLLNIELTLKRKPLYFSLNILAPILLLCLLNPLVFILPMESGERVSYAVTIFLSFAVFMTLISDTMPKVSQPMSRLSYLIFTAMAYSTFICVGTILTMRLYYKDEDATIPSWLAYIYKVCHGCGCCKRFCCDRCRDGKSKVKDIENEGTTKVFTRKNDESGADKETEEKKPSTVQSITWKHIAMLTDEVLFLGSVVFVIIVSILTYTLLAASK